MTFGIFGVLPSPTAICSPTPVHSQTSVPPSTLVARAPPLSLLAILGPGSFLVPSSVFPRDWISPSLQSVRRYLSTPSSAHCAKVSVNLVLPYLYRHSTTSVSTKKCKRKADPRAWRESRVTGYIGTSDWKTKKKKKRNRPPPGIERQQKPHTRDAQPFIAQRYPCPRFHGTNKTALCSSSAPTLHFRSICLSESAECSALLRPRRVCPQSRSSPVHPGASDLIPSDPFSPVPPASASQGQSRATVPSPGTARYLWSLLFSPPHSPNLATVHHRPRPPPGHHLLTTTDGLVHPASQPISQHKPPRPRARPSNSKDVRTVPSSPSPQSAVVPGPTVTRHWSGTERRLVSLSPVTTQSATEPSHGEKATKRGKQNLLRLAPRRTIESPPSLKPQSAPVSSSSSLLSRYNPFWKTPFPPIAGSQPQRIQTVSPPPTKHCPFVWNLPTYIRFARAAALIHLADDPLLQDHNPDDLHCNPQHHIKPTQPATDQRPQRSILTPLPRISSWSPIAIQLTAPYHYTSKRPWSRESRLSTTSIRALPDYEFPATLRTKAHGAKRP